MASIHRPACQHTSSTAVFHPTSASPSRTHSLQPNKLPHSSLIPHTTIFSPQQQLKLNRRRLSTLTSATSPQDSNPASLAIDDVIINPSFRSTPAADDTTRTILSVLFISESGVCRAPLAAAIFTQVALDAGFTTEEISCEAAATRDYNLGETVDLNVQLIAAEMCVAIDEGYKVRQLDEGADVAEFDIMVVMDKYTAADVLREISVFETICPGAFYSSKVRRIGEFHPSALKPSTPTTSSTSTTSDTTSTATTAQAGPQANDEEFDIQDPLYGNIGGDQELKSIRTAGSDIEKCCQGLVQYLKEVQGSRTEDGLRKKVAAALKERGGIDWLVPPMLQNKK